MSDLDKLTRSIIKFRDARNWKQFHNPKDLSLSLVLEATEVMEHFQWKSKEEIEGYIKTNRDAIAEELADTLYWILLLSNDLHIDIGEALKKKMEQNEKKYPVENQKIHIKNIQNYNDGIQYHD